MDSVQNEHVFKIVCANVDFFFLIDVMIILLTKGSGKIRLIINNLFPIFCYTSILVNFVSTLQSNFWKTRNLLKSIIHHFYGSQILILVHAWA